jgi:clan AA aspartic protease (TIGR02281 family)
MNAADIVDTSHVDAVFANQQRNADSARRRAMIWTVGKSALWGGVGLGALLFGASFLIQPKIVKVPELIEVPTVYETTKVVEVPKIIEVPAGAKVKRAPAGSEAPSTTPGKPPAPESHPWSELTDKQYVGVITDIIGDHVCFDHGRSNDHCVWVAVTDSFGHAVLDVDGNPVPAPDIDFEPMRKWIGHSAYKAPSPNDPTHLNNYWVADNGTLIKFIWQPKDQRAADSVPLRSDDDGHSLSVEVGLGLRKYSLLLDTGATNTSITKDVADQLVREGHAVYGSDEKATMADGSSHKVQTLTIDAVMVGIHQVNNVQVLVSPNGMMLLGLDVLSQIGRFTVDAQDRQLIFNGAAT